MLRIKLILLVLVFGCASAMAADPVIQLINLSADSTMEIVKVEYGDSVLVDSLEFNKATAYIEVPADAGTTLTFTSLSDPLESFQLSGLTLTDDDIYQSILFGVIDTNAYAANPDGKSLALNATWNAVDAAGIAAGDVRTNFFHAAGDAVEMDVADFLLEYIVDDMAFGEYSSVSTDLPATLRNIFFLSTDSVTQIASRSVDLGAVTGNTATIFISGFIVPVANNNGPVISFKVVDEAGTVTTLGFVLAVFNDLLHADLNLYPNPASDYIHLDLTTGLAMQVQISLIDLSGKEHLKMQQNLASGRSNLRLDLPELPRGLYFIQLSNDSGMAVLPIVIQ